MKHVILGASGQVGSAIVSHLLDNGEQVRAVIRDTQKAAGWKNSEQRSQ